MGSGVYWSVLGCSFRADPSCCGMLRSRVTRQEEGKGVWAAAAGTPKLRLSVAPHGQGVVREEHRLEACATGREPGVVREDGTHGTHRGGGGGEERRLYHASRVTRQGKGESV